MIYYHKNKIVNVVWTFVRRKICNEIHDYFLSQILKKRKRLQIVVWKMFKRLRALTNVACLYIEFDVSDYSRSMICFIDKFNCFFHVKMICYHVVMMSFQQFDSYELFFKNVITFSKFQKIISQNIIWFDKSITLMFVWRFDVFKTCLYEDILFL
jgi:hypothetical protein